jgi:hypothetical protein
MYVAWTVTPNSGRPFWQYGRVVLASASTFSGNWALLIEHPASTRLISRQHDSVIVVTETQFLEGVKADRKHLLQRRHSKAKRSR